MADEREGCQPDNHCWYNRFGEGWTPDDYILCDCRTKRWDERKGAPWRPVEDSDRLLRQAALGQGEK